MNRVQTYRPLGRLNEQQRDEPLRGALGMLAEDNCFDCSGRVWWGGGDGAPPLGNPSLRRRSFCPEPARLHVLDLQFSNYWTWSRRDHVQELAGVWDILGEDVRDRRPSAVLGDPSLTGTLAAP